MMYRNRTYLSVRSKYIINLLLSITLFISSCSEKNNSNSPETISIDLSNLKTIRSSDIFNNISYVKLETIEDNIIGSVTKVCVSGDKFYLLSPYPLNTVAVFNRDGKFLFQIKNSGRGPEEFISLADIQVNEYIWLLDDSSKRLFKFSLNGEFIEIIHLDILVNKFVFLDDNTLAFYSNNNYNEINNEVVGYQLIFMNLPSYETVNYALPFSDNMKNIKFRDFVNFNSLNGSVSFSHSYDATVYQISSQKMQVTPKFYFNFGKNAITRDILQKKYSDVRKLDMTIIENNLVWRLGNNFREMKNIIFSSFLHNGKLHHLIISKKSGLTFCYNTIINDMEGNESSNSLPRGFQPLASSENGLIFLIEPTKIIKDVNEVKKRLNSSEW